MPRVRVSPRSALVRARPSMPGMFRSLTTTSGTALRASSRPARPSSATRTSNPSSSRKYFTTVTTVGLSSTIRTRARPPFRPETREPPGAED